MTFTYSQKEATTTTSVRIPTRLYTESQKRGVNLSAFLAQNLETYLGGKTPEEIKKSAGAREAERRKELASLAEKCRAEVAASQNARLGRCAPEVWATNINRLHDAGLDWLEARELLEGKRRLSA